MSTAPAICTESIILYHQNHRQEHSGQRLQIPTDRYWLDGQHSDGGKIEISDDACIDESDT